MFNRLIWLKEVTLAVRNVAVQAPIPDTSITVFLENISLAEPKNRTRNADKITLPSPTIFSKFSYVKSSTARLIL